jgi:hypothetical protein
MKFEKYNLKNYLLCFFLYITIIIGFIFDENLNFGSYYDWINVYKTPINDFSLNFKDTLLSYDKYGQRHSPIYLIFLSIFLDLGLSFDTIRIIHLHLCLSLILIFYLCLKLVFVNVKLQSLQLLSFIIFLSPTFRSLSIWPDSRLPGLIFFILAIYFFLKFLREGNIKYAWFNSISLIISSYISPNFCLFVIYFYFFYMSKLQIKKIIPLIAFNMASAIPALYYIFILKINFLISGRTSGLNGESVAFSFNFSDKIMIISSIILFHLLPILWSINIYRDFLIFIKKNIYKVFIIFIPLVYFFNYQLVFTGGGVFFQGSQALLSNNYIFYLICLLSIMLILYFSKLSINNFILIFLIIISNIQNTIYHKYYEPMILIIFFTLFNKINLRLFFEKKNNLIYLYIFSLSFIFLRFVKNFNLI